MNFRNRLPRLEAASAPSEAECDGGTTALVERGPGGALYYTHGRPFDPTAAHRCAKCGGQHVLVLVRRIVTAAGAGDG